MLCRKANKYSLLALDFGKHWMPGKEGEIFVPHLLVRKQMDTIIKDVLMKMMEIATGRLNQSYSLDVLFSTICHTLQIFQK